MSDRNRAEIGLKIVLIAGTGLTLSISGHAMEQIAAATPQQAFVAFRQAVLDGQVQLAASGQALTGGDEKMQDFSNVFKQQWNKDSPA